MNTDSTPLPEPVNNLVAGTEGASYEFFFTEADATFAGDTDGFKQANLNNRWSLARYLIGRALGESILRTVLLTALILLGVTVALTATGSIFWGIVFACLTVCILAVRSLLAALLARLTIPELEPTAQRRLSVLVAATRRDVLAELRRIGLPGRTWSLPILGIRLARRSRRPQVVAQLRMFEAERVVSAARLDEFYLLLQQRSTPPHGTP